MWIVNVRHAGDTTARMPCAGEECDAIRYAAWLASKNEGDFFSWERDGVVGQEFSREDVIAWAYARCSYLAPLR